MTTPVAEPTRGSSIDAPRASSVERLGARTVRVVAEFGRMAQFAGRVTGVVVRPPWRGARWSTEVFDAGVLSLAIVCLSGFTVGGVLALQGYNTLVRFGAEESLGAVVGLVLIRELGPVLTGLLVTGRAGSAMAAEIGMMVATEQIDGMKTMAVDPMHFVVGPKALGITFVMPLLTALFVVFGVAGGYLVGVQFLGLDGGVYLSALENAVEFRSDVLGSLLKGLAFGMLVAWIATYRGYTCGRSAASVSTATTQTVVTGSVAILLADYVITAFWGV